MEIEMERLKNENLKSVEEIDDFFSHYFLCRIN